MDKHFKFIKLCGGGEERDPIDPALITSGVNRGFFPLGSGIWIDDWLYTYGPVDNFVISLKKIFSNSNQISRGRIRNDWGFKLSPMQGVMHHL